MAIREDMVAIAVIGVNGSGKSSFINLASGSKLPFGDLLDGHSPKLKSSEFSLDGRAVVLIDTPGFGDSPPSVLGVLKSISDHFSGLYSQGIKLAGVIYMHYIPEDRMRSASRHSFQIFTKFCGDTSLRDILIVTNERATDHPTDVKARAEKPLHDDEVFGPAIDQGAQVLCHDGSQSSAHAIIRRFLDPKPAVPSSQGDSHGRTDQRCSATSVAAVRELSGRVKHHTNAFGKLCQGIDAAILPEDKATRKTLQEEAKDSLEEIERLRHDLEKMVTACATENSRLSAENHRYKTDFTTQKTVSEHRKRALEEQRRARELSEARRERAEAQLAEERALWERQKMEKGDLPARERAGPKYDKLFACGAVIFILLYVSRYV